MSINWRKLRKNGNETLLFVGTRDAPSTHDAYLGSTRCGVRERTGSASERVRCHMLRYRQRDELYDDDADNDDGCSFRPLLLTTGQLEEGEDGPRSAKVMKVVGDGGWSIPSDTGEQWMPGRCVGKVRGKMNGLNCVSTNDACVPFFAQTGRPNADVNDVPVGAESHGNH